MSSLTDQALSAVHLFVLLHCATGGNCLLCGHCADTRPFWDQYCTKRTPGSGCALYAFLLGKALLQEGHWPCLFELHIKTCKDGIRSSWRPRALLHCA